MAEQEKIPSLGRGRGRARADGSREGSVSSPSDDKRTVADQAGGSGAEQNGNGRTVNGNGQKRGALRDQHAIAYRTRPENIKTKEGSSGKLITLNANYFRMIKKPNFQFTIYRVDFVPDVEMDRLRKAFVGQQRQTLGGYLYDGQNQIYLTRCLDREVMEFQVTSREGQEYTLTLRNTGRTIDMTEPTAMQILNVILRRAMDGLQMQLVGRNMYDPTNKINFENYKLELWPGYITSIRQHEAELLICCEVSHKVMRTQTILTVLNDCFREDEYNYKNNFKKAIVGSIVLTDYNNKTYRVDDVNFGASPRDTFTLKEREISYLDYYREKYGKIIGDEKQPMLISNPKPRDIRDGRGDQVIYLVPELSRATGLTDNMRGNFIMMRDLARYTQMPPPARKPRLLDFSRRMRESEESQRVFDGFNTQMDNQLIEFRGRALAQETMLFGNNKTSANNDGVDWTNAMKDSVMYESVPLLRWILIYPKRNQTESKAFLEALRRVAEGMRYEMGNPKIVEIENDRIQTFTQAVQQAISKDPKMIMIVVPNNKADLYAAIKTMTCVSNAIPTQVVVSRTLTPKKGSVMSIATKVMIQVNCKLGGAPWMIKFPLKGVMAIGFDVSHDTRDRSRSFGAFVATMDLKEKVNFFSACTPHKDGAEMSSNIELHLVNALKAFKGQHNALPERIIFYRDGVGDGQIPYIHIEEVSRLNEQLNSIYLRVGGGKTPKFTFIIVSKRLNTRIFLKQGANVTNPVSGTIVDNTITLPERYDFFLVSQSVRQGTVAPTSYNIIYDTSGLTPDQMQIISYKYTHLYYNWSGCTRVPAVVQYAHKLAELVAQHLHQLPSTSFDKQLYFL